MQKKKRNTNKIYKDHFELVLELNSESFINRLLNPEDDSNVCLPVTSGKKVNSKKKSKNKINNSILTKLKKPR